MAEHQANQTAAPQRAATGHPGDTKVADSKLPQTKGGVAAPTDVIAPRVVQSEFPEHMRAGLPGMINRMVDYNAVTRSSEQVPIPAARAVCQSQSSDIGATLGGAVTQFVGITILDPTLIVPLSILGVPQDAYPPYTNMGVLTKGEMFAICDTATLSGDPLYYGAADGILAGGAGAGPVPGGRWKYTRAAGELNVVQLGIQT
jgi:hypothetical protein